MTEGYEQYYIPEAVTEVEVTGKIKNLVCADCSQPLAYSSADIDWDDLDDNHLPKMTYLYVCQPCGLKCKSTTQYPRLELDSGTGEDFAVIPAPPQYGQSVPS